MSFLSKASQQIFIRDEFRFPTTKQKNQYTNHFQKSTIYIHRVYHSHTQVMAKSLNVFLVLTFSILAVLGTWKEDMTVCAEKAVVAFNNGEIHANYRHVETFPMKTDPDEVSLHVELDVSKLPICSAADVVTAHSHWRKGEQQGTVVATDIQRVVAKKKLQRNGGYRYQRSSPRWSPITKQDFFKFLKPYAVAHFWPTPEKKEQKARRAEYGEFFYDDSGLF